MLQESTWEWTNSIILILRPLLERNYAPWTKSNAKFAHAVSLALALGCPITVSGSCMYLTYAPWQQQQSSSRLQYLLQVNAVRHFLAIDIARINSCSRSYPWKPAEARVIHLAEEYA